MSVILSERLTNRSSSSHRNSSQAPLAHRETPRASSARGSTFRSTSIDPVSERPTGVTKEGLQNYLKHSGTLNISDWAIEGKRSATPRAQNNENQGFPEHAMSAKVVGDDARKNYLKNTTTTPNLLTSDYQPPNPRHGMRVKREAHINYLRDRESRVKSLLQNYGKLPDDSSKTDDADPPQRGVYEQHKRSRVGDLLSNYNNFPLSARPVSRVKGEKAEQNQQNGLGRSNIITHDAEFRPPTSDPSVKGAQAEENYRKGQGHSMNALIHQYGTFPLSDRTAPKIKYGGHDILNKARGDAMRKTLSHCPPSNRRRERPLPAN